MGIINTLLPHSSVAAAYVLDKFITKDHTLNQIRLDKERHGIWRLDFIPFYYLQSRDRQTVPSLVDF